MKSKILGQLTQNEYDTDMFESKPVKIPYFDFKEIVVAFFEPTHPPQLIASDKVIDNFLHLNSKNKEKDAHLVYKYYKTTLELGYTKTLKIKEVKDIWNFVIPSEIIIDSDENGDFYLYVSCGCEWEEEHGLQLVFKNGQTLIKAEGH